MPLPYSSSALKSTNLKEMVAEARRMQQMEEWKRNGAAESAAKRKQADAAGAALEYAKRGLARSQAPLESRVDISIPDQESGNYRPLENFKDATPADLEQTGVSSDAMGGPEQNVSAVDRKARLATELRKARLQAATTKPADYAPGDAAQTAINIPSPSAQASGYRAPEPVDGSQAAMKDQTREDWKPSGLQTLMGQTANAATLGNADRIAGLTAFMPGGDGDYSKARARARDTMASGREENPNWAMGGEVAGLISPAGPFGALTKLGMKAGAPLIRGAAQLAPKIGFLGAPVRVGAKLLTAGVVGAADGALYGGTVGAENKAMERGEGSPSMAQRGQEAGNMAKLGAGTGAAFQAAAPLLRKGGRMIEGAGASVLETLGIAPGAVARQTAKVADEAVRRDLERAGIVTIDDYLARAAKYEGKPAVLGDIGQSMTNTLSALVRKPGTTAEKAMGILEGRVADMPGRVLKDLADETGLSVDDIAGDIERMMTQSRANAGPAYRGAEAAPFNQTERLDAMAADSPALSSAVKEAQKRMANEAAAAGVPVESLPKLRLYDEAKRILDEEVEALKKNGKSPGSVEQVRAALVKELDNIVPDLYPLARELGGDAPRINEAFGKGKAAVGGKLGWRGVETEVAKLMGQPLTAYQSGVIENIGKAIEQGGQPRRFLNPDFQKKLRSVFGDEAADGIIRKLKLEGELAQKGSRWNPNVGSTTGQSMLSDPNNALNAVAGVAKGAAQIAKGNWAQPVIDTIAMLRRKGFSEKQLDAIGELLLSNTDDAGARLFPGQTPKNPLSPIPPAGKVRTNGPAGGNALTAPVQPVQPAPVQAIAPPPVIQAPQASGLKFAAIRYKDANGRMQILRGKDHVEIEAIADKKFAGQDHDTERGFIGANGKFVSGMDAALDALSAGQIKDPQVRAFIESQIKAGKQPVVTSEMLDFSGKGPKPPKTEPPSSGGGTAPVSPRQQAINTHGPDRTTRFETPNGREYRVDFEKDGDAVAVDFREQGRTSTYRPTSDNSLADAKTVLAKVREAIEDDITRHARPKYVFAGETKQQRDLYQQIARSKAPPKGYRWEGPDKIGNVYLVRE